MTDATKAIVAACISAGATVTVAVFSLLAAYMANKRDRRRTLYSEAIRTAVGWKEMVYRVRRRTAGQEQELINQFHELQDRLAYYQSWVGSESAAMKRSYDTFVGSVKGCTEQLIRAAWEEPIRPVPGNARTSDEHPDLSDLTDTFLTDVRSHLSPWPWRKAAVRWRNRRR